jgi:hypothetical protein
VQHEPNERRRRLFATVVQRMALKPKAQRDLVDVLFGLTSFPFFAQLLSGGRSAAAAGEIIQDLASDAVRRAENA